MKSNIIWQVFVQFKYLKIDIMRWQWTTIEDSFYNIFEPGLWVIILFRFSRALFLIDIPILKIIIRLTSFLISKFSELCLGALIRPGTDIGPGLYIGHTGVVRIHPDIKAGKNLSIGQLVTIGARGVGHKGVPVIGDNVYIGVGAKILGEIKIGNNVKIGANAVVITDVPDNATAVGVPARIIMK